MENEKLEVVVARHDEQIKELKKDVVEIKDITKLIYEISSDIKLLFQQGSSTNKELTEMKEDFAGMKKDVSGMKDDINDVKVQADKKDAKKWDKLIWLIIGVIVTTVAGIVKTALGI